ncbi:hypothetical protein DPMN_147570 [Dreissena polymorpha]|uniref:Uncharacterized protein n=1 Tax=Dreissena polymorpha TaxID=45954 RepID=A0A9D4FA34_DREPO|nr:hypothetical protein DPMN_147570 [Dreissena polymorpha]
MHRLELPLCILIVATTGVVAIGKFCSSGAIGPACDQKNPCTHGYTCIRRTCCRDVTCPFGGAGPSCSNRNPCKPGYYCNKGTCCWEYTCRPEELDIRCSAKRPCPNRSVCQSGECCRQPVCPDERASDGVCSPSNSPRFTCRPGYECVNGICCEAIAQARAEVARLDIGQVFDAPPSEPRTQTGRAQMAHRRMAVRKTMAVPQQVSECPAQIMRVDPFASHLTSAKPLRIVAKGSSAAFHHVQDLAKVLDFPDNTTDGNHWLFIIVNEDCNCFLVLHKEQH